MLAGNLAAIGVGGIVATAASYIVGRLRLSRNLIRGIQRSLLGSGRKTSTLISPVPSTRRAHDLLTSMIPLREMRTKRRKRSKLLRSRTTKPTTNSTLSGYRRHSSSRPGVPSYWWVYSSSWRILSDELGRITLDASNDHPHSASPVLCFNRLRRGRAYRQVGQVGYRRTQADPRVFVFAAWVVVGMIWTFCSSFIVVLYPLWESRVAIGQIGKGIVKVSALLSSYDRAGAELYFSLLASCDCVGHLFSWKWKVYEAYRIVKVVK